MSDDTFHFIIIEFDGWNVGLIENFSSTYLVFDSFNMAMRVAKSWDRWIEHER